MNEEPKLMKMQNYSKKKLKDGMTKESKSVSLKLENMFFCTTLVSDSVGFRVPAKPLRFEQWGAHEDLPLPNHALSLTAISRPSSMNPQHKRHEIYTGSGHRCGVIPYSSVVVVDCLLG